MDSKTIAITVDGKSIEVDPGRNLIEACAGAGARIPTLCYMKDISSNASCGVCVVEVEGATRACRRRVGGLELGPVGAIPLPGVGPSSAE